MTNKELATKIVQTLKENSAPGACTWGDEFTLAHSNLFYFYFESLVDDVEQWLNKNEDV